MGGGVSNQSSGPGAGIGRAGAENSNHFLSFSTSPSSSANNKNENDNKEQTGRMKNLQENKNANGLDNVNVSVYILYPEIIQWKEHFQMLKFSDNEIARLYRSFKKLRLPETESVSIISLLEFCSLHDSPFLCKYFNILQNPANNIENFYDFVMILWHFCTIGKDLSSLIFDLYDVEQKHQIDGLLADQMVKEIYGKKFEKSQVALQLIIRMQRQSPKVVPRYFFIEFIYANPILLQPCTVYRRRITDVFLGKQIWDRLQEDRIILTRGAYYHLRDVISMTNQYATLVKKQNLLQKQLQLAADTNSINSSSSSPAPAPPSHLVTRTVRASTAPLSSSSGGGGRRPRMKSVGYQTADIILGNKTLKPIIQRGEYDESIQLIIKPTAPTRAPKRIQALTCYGYVA